MDRSPSKPAFALNPRYKWYLVGMLWWISFFNYADRQAIFSVFDPLQKEFSLSDRELGYLGSSFAVVYGVSAPFAGMIVDRVKRKAAILGGLQAWSLICMATAVSRNFLQLIFFRAAEGLGETFYYPASVSTISDYHTTRTRSWALGMHQTSVYVGTIAGGYFAALISDHYGWRYSFLVFGGLGAALGFLLARFLIEPRRGAADGALTDSSSAGPETRLPLGQTLRVIWGQPTVLMLMAAFVCANFVAMVLLAWMPKFLGDKFDFKLPLAGLTATVYPQLGSMAGAFFGGWWADRLRLQTSRGRILVQVVGVLGGAPFVYLCGQAETKTLLIVALTGWGLFKGLYDANIFAAVYDVVPAHARGSVVGFMNMMGWLVGGATGPTVIALLSEHIGFSWAISSAALVYLAAAGFLLAATVTKSATESRTT